MTWEAKIEHEDCPSGGTRDKQSGFESTVSALEWVCSRLRQHTTNTYGAPTETLSITVTIKETCLHDKQALWVRAAREFMAKTGGFYYDDTDAPTNVVYLQTSRLVDKLATCAKCGEAVE